MSAKKNASGSLTDFQFCPMTICTVLVHKRVGAAPCLIPDHERILLIEDTAEIQIQGKRPSLRSPPRAERPACCYDNPRSFFCKSRPIRRTLVGAVGIEFTSPSSKSRKRNGVAPPPLFNWSLLEPSCFSG